MPSRPLTRWLLLGLLIAPTAAATAADEPGPPNLVLIISDDQAYTDFGFMGHPVVKTPHIDALAARSAAFPAGYVPTSLCRASLATLLTGQYGHEHCICFNDPPEGTAREAAHPFLQKAPALPRLLAEKGYRSLQTGKYWEGHYANAGFTDGMTVKGRHGDTGLAIGRQTMKPIADFLDAGKGKGTDRPQPFFLWYAPMMPHEPHNPPAKYRALYEGKGLDQKTQLYYAMITWFDDTVGELMGLLEDRKLREDTLVLFVVDNGWITPGPGEPPGRFSPRSKNSPYEGGVRTPILIDWPGHTRAGVRPDLVSTVDVVPTLLDAAGILRPDALSGLSLLPVATGAGRLDRDAVFGELYLHTAVSLNEPAVNLTYRWVRQGPWKLIAPAGDQGETMLFHLEDDPAERRNLAADPAHRDRLEALKARLDAWWNPRSTDLKEAANP